MPKASSPRLGRRSGAGSGVESPGNFGRGKIRVEQQAGHRRDLRLATAGFQRGTRFRRTPVLPNDRVADRLAGRAIPDERGLALIRDPNRGQRGRLARRRGATPPGQSKRRSTKATRGSCSTQPGLRKNLRDFLLASATGAPSASKTMARVDVVPWSMTRTPARKSGPVGSGPLPSIRRGPAEIACVNGAGRRREGRRQSIQRAPPSAKRPIYAAGRCSGRGDRTRISSASPRARASGTRPSMNSADSP